MSTTERNNKIEDSFGGISLKTQVSEVGNFGETRRVVVVGIKILGI